jgi:ornithine cyclodeaminase
MTRSAKSAEDFRTKMKNSSFPSDTEWEIEIAADKSEFRSCQLIHTVTCSREAILDVGDVDFERPEGVHITAVGSDTEGKEELSVPLMRKADLWCCDCASDWPRSGRGGIYKEFDRNFERIS